MRLIWILGLFSLMAYGAAQPDAYAAAAKGQAIAPEIAETLLPHKALYDITMVKAKNGSQVVNVTGQMLYEFRKTCDAWSTDHRFDLEYEYADAAPLRIVSQFSLYEAMDGSALDFNVKRERNGLLYEEIRGRAERGPGNVLNVTYSLPENTRKTYDKDTVFPIEHTIALLNELQMNKKVLSKQVFDGGDMDGPMFINAVIGQPLKSDSKLSNNPTGSEALTEKAQNVRLAFFKLDAAQAQAEYEMDVALHKNGVISDLLIDYEDFVVRQELNALEKFENPKCKP